MFPQPHFTGTDFEPGASPWTELYQDEQPTMPQPQQQASANDADEPSRMAMDCIYNIFTHEERPQ